MKPTIRHTLKSSVLIGMLCLFLNNFSSGQEYQRDFFPQLVHDFRFPIAGNGLWCYWYWINDDISREGITRDLQAMKDVGITNAFIGNIDRMGKNGPVPVLSEEWWDHMVHAVVEGNRIGVDIGVFNCPGWSQSGGPWISSEQAMRFLVHTETYITGGSLVQQQLHQPRKLFQDLRVLAFPRPPQEKAYYRAANAQVTFSPTTANANYLIDGDENTAIEFTADSYVIEIAGEQPLAARSLLLKPNKGILAMDVLLEALTNDGWEEVRTFRFDRSDTKIAIGPDRYAPVSVALTATTANRFRFTCSKIHSRVADERGGLAEIRISEAPVIEDYIEKHLGKMHPTPFPEWDSYVWETQAEADVESISVDSVLDISQFMDAQGQLSWDAPAGEWAIMRIGMTPTGTKNSPAAPSASGYEVDKANRELIRYHFEQFVLELKKRIPESAQKALKYVVADSYEKGPQNWTDGFGEKFTQKFGYDPIKYLPVFSGRIVGSAEESERFLWDLRRAMADDIAYEYVGGLREICNEHGLKLWLENYGHWGFPAEFMMYGGQSDIIGGEFWNEGKLGDIECKAASSTAHVYGKKIISAECFTSGHRTYVRHPAMLKKRGDWSLTEGINHHVMHVYIHQPDEKRVPGINATFATEFNRHNTWFKEATPYFTYLRRAQHMLQQGLYVADVCYFIGEDVPMMTGPTTPELPAGYSFDYINAEAILQRLSVKDGRLTLPDGMSYKLMILPEKSTMRPEILAKLEELVRAGAAIWGSAPSSSPSLEGYPQSDEQVRKIASRLWKGSRKIRSVGKGKLFDGLGLQETLDSLQLEPDLEVHSDILWTHRSTEETDIYFLTNKSDEARQITPSFRVDGLQPQLWDAVTGEVRTLNEYSAQNSRTNLPLTLEKHQSAFIVFTKQKSTPPHSGYAKNSPVFETIRNIDSPWKVTFEDLPNPSSTIDELFEWTTSSDKSIRYYSGSTSYETNFDFTGNLSKPNFIHLENVGVIAEVTLNGKPVGTTWIAPHRLDISNELKTGQNTLNVRITNVWRNRLTGDIGLPSIQKKTWVLENVFTEEDKLVPSGLWGAVEIQTIED